MSRGKRLRQPLGPYTAVVDDLAHDGRGVTRIEGKAVFVPEVLPGERVRVTVTHRRRKFDEGRLDDIVEPAERRVTPRCPHFGVCGGCSLQHMAPEAQIEYKQQQFLETLSRIGGVQPSDVATPLSGHPWGYRRRARLGVKYVPKKGGALVGFRERAAPYVAVLEGCEVLEPVVGHRIMALRELINALSIRARIPQIEVAVADNATALVFRVMDPPNEADLETLSAFGTEHDIWIYLQSGGPDTIRPLSEEAPGLYYELPEFDVRVGFEPTDFIQINGALNRAMVGRALEWLAPHPDERVLDLFSGLGNFSLPLGRRAKEVLAVEGDAGLVARGQKNARLNGLDNVQFKAVDLFDTREAPAWLKEGFDRVLLDPPRSGAREILPHVVAHRPKSILYVSCHPATLARDVGYLVQTADYRLNRVCVMDMFPHTAHVEAIARLDAQ